MENPPGRVARQEKSLAEELRPIWWKILVLLAFVVLVAITISKHEPWFDETQAWLIARGTNPITLLFKYLRYEGHPGLWHLLLMLPAKLKLPVLTMNLIAGAAMVVAVYLILFRSPFPTILKVMLPFSYFFFYQYSVVARNYSLIPLLLFLIAFIYRRRNERPYTYFLLLILLANVSLHGTVIAIALLAMHLMELNRTWKTLSTKNRKKQIIGIAAFALILLLLVLMLWPPSDIRSPAKYNFGIANFYRTGVSALDESMASYWYLSFFVLVLLLLWFYKKRLLFLYCIITVPLLVFFAVIYSVSWHFGILFAVLVFVLWISFDEDDQSPMRKPRLGKVPLREIAIASMVLILAIQIYYSVQSVRAELRVTYSSSYNLAIYIKENHLEDKKIDMVGVATQLNAYFDRNIFHNYHGGQAPSFWVYSKINDDIAQVNKTNIRKVVDDNPDYIVAPYYSMAKRGLKIPGYRELLISYGTSIWEGKLFELDSSILYKRIKP